MSLKILAIIFVVLGVGLLFLVGAQLRFKKAAFLPPGYIFSRSAITSRDKNPILFWFAITFNIIFGLYALFIGLYSLFTGLYFSL